MVAGGFRNDLLALSDDTPHDERYDRLVEYAGRHGAPLQREADHVRGSLLPCQDEAHASDASNFSRVSWSRAPRQPGSRRRGKSARLQSSTLALRRTNRKRPTGRRVWVRVGIIARSRADQAWSVARERFPEDRKGRITHELAVKVSDSSWHHQLSVRRPEEGGDGDPYWLGPFQNYKTFCPYLVGSYDRVAIDVAGYLRAGFTTFILDIPPSREELEHTNVVFSRARALVAHP